MCKGKDDCKNGVYERYVSEKEKCTRERERGMCVKVIYTSHRVSAREMVCVG